MEANKQTKRPASRADRQDQAKAWQQQVAKPSQEMHWLMTSTQTKARLGGG